jgi:hypothetical protein
LRHPILIGALRPLALPILEDYLLGPPDSWLIPSIKGSSIITMDGYYPPGVTIDSIVDLSNPMN